MRIDQIQSDKKRFLNLLLLADEQETMIDRYLERGEMFVMRNARNEPVCSAVLTDEGDGTCELKNLAVIPSDQRKGYGSRMIDFLCRYYAGRFKYMLVGTGDSKRTVAFYKHCGFRYAYTVSDFFTLHYDHPIIEDGQILKDMIYFRKALVCPSPVCRDERTDSLIASLLVVWEDSVRASHGFLTEADICGFIPMVREAISLIETLVVLFQGGEPVGFIGMEQHKIEMLFLSPDSWGCGFGKLLVHTAVKEYGCIFVDVNEQNPKARDFYTHMGFRAFERTETDEQGNPFPIIRMRLPE